MAGEPALRFAVLDHSGRPLSSVWRLWNNNDDVYVGVRSLAGVFKTSLHASGLHRHAFATDEQSVRFRGPDQDRAVQKWTRPAAQHESATLLFQVAFPGAGLGSYIPDYSLPSKLSALPSVPEDAVGYVSVSDVEASGQGKTIRFGETAAGVLHNCVLPKGTELVVTWHMGPLTNELATTLRRFANGLRSLSVPPELNQEDLGTRSFLVMQSPDGIGRLVDVGIKAVVEWAGKTE